MAESSFTGQSVYDQRLNRYNNSTDGMNELEAMDWRAPMDSEFSNGIGIKNIEPIASSFTQQSAPQNFKQIGDGKFDFYNPMDYTRDFSQHGQLKNGFIADGKGGFRAMNTTEMKNQNLGKQSDYMDSMIAKNNEFDIGGAVNVGIGVAQTAMNIGSYFDQQKFNRERLGALKDNRQYASLANARKTKFHNAADSVFA